MRTGTVRWYDADAGILCIRPDEGPRDYLAPVAAIQTRLKILMEGERVRFDPAPPRGNRLAQNIRPL